MKRVEAGKLNRCCWSARLGQGGRRGGQKLVRRGLGGPRGGQGGRGQQGGKGLAWEDHGPGRGGGGGARGGHGGGGGLDGFGGKKAGFFCSGGVPPMADTGFQHFRVGVQGASRGGPRGSRVVHL